MRVKLLIPPSFELPILWLAGIGIIRLGVHLRDGWCIDVEGRTKALSQQEDAMPLLPLLEIGRATFYEYLHRVAEIRNELADAIQSFPATFLLKFAFESSVSEYWPLKALDWVNAEAAVDPEIGESLQKLLSRPWVTQRLKQRAEKAAIRASFEKTPKTYRNNEKNGDAMSSRCGQALPGNQRLWPGLYT